MRKILVTGAAGFIGSHLARHFLREAPSEGTIVVGLDNLDAADEPALQRARLALLRDHPGFRFHRLDIAEPDALAARMDMEQPEVVVHLAARAGVRQSLAEPFRTTRSNVTGHLAVLEACRRLPRPPRLVYASSSSVYGGGALRPRAEADTAERPASLYAATKRADELMSDTYAGLYGLPQVGLRFFTVYGPWGRPDMACWRFADRIMKGEPLPLFNGGAMHRDFTYIDDIVSGIAAVATQPLHFPDGHPHRIYNIGCGRPVLVSDFVDLLERAIGRPAIREPLPMQPGDVEGTWADTSALARDHGYRPAVPVEEGIRRFVAWFRARYPNGVPSA